ncbi:hypothetical protein Bca4012_057917 [Brassica carinata]|uniref:NmrA-like domain-containing protein n=1 Tax=Brassica carinata TaxID=52824 RepID=A0A8X7TL31_BRACI|nr:hypothetical protein Bca52824_094131 [Brassica carinata]
MDPEEDFRHSKRQHEHINMLSFVADSEYGIPKRCLCGGRLINEVRENEAYDSLPGKRFFTCRNYEADGLHYRQPWVIGVQEELERLTKRVEEAEQSEFGTDVDKTGAVEPAKPLVFGAKRRIRRAVEAEGIPYTYVFNNCAAGLYLCTLLQFQPGLTSPPRDKVTILGDGNAKVVFNKEEDVAAYMIRAVDDPRILNQTVYISPPKNVLSMNELVALWENNIGKSLEKTYISEEEGYVIFLAVSPVVPVTILLSINHSVFVKEDQTNFTIEPTFGVEASELYPDVKYTSIEEYLSHFA